VTEAAPTTGAGAPAPGRRLQQLADLPVTVLRGVGQAVAQDLQKFRRDTPGVSFRGWLWGITRNKVRDHYRRTMPNQRRATPWTSHMSGARLWRN